MNDSGQIYVAGHKGMVGSAIVRRLQSQGYGNIITCDKSELNLKDQVAVQHFFEQREITQVFLAAAKVGGIHANNIYPADFIYDNLIIECNIINAAHSANVNKILFLGSSCIYPKLSEQPITEEALLTGALEPTNEPYAIAKIAGIKLCESYNRQFGRDYRSIMPTNLYGPGDNYHKDESHVIPGLIRRFHEAKECDAGSVAVWGSGKVYREFLFSEDLADACCYLMSIPKEKYMEKIVSPMCSHLNVGYGEDITIKDLALEIARVVGYEGEIVFDKSKPDGTPKKLLDSSRLKELGWSPSTSLAEGLVVAYQDFLNNYDKLS
ncbi:GDP-L-fucose synthase [Aurantivibrio plasticivorans]